MKRFAQDRLYVFLFFIILGVSLRTILLSDRLIGHNWDFSFPYPGHLFSRIIYFSIYTWFDFNLGFVPILNLSHIVPNFMLSALGTWVGSVTATKILLVTVITVSFFSYKKLVDYLVKAQTVNYIPSFLFAFSPFLFNEIIGGSWYMWISYAAAPLYMYSTFRVAADGKWRYLALYLATSVFVVSSLQNLVCISFITAAYTIYCGHRKSSAFAALKRYILLHLVLLIANAYWLVSFVKTFTDFNSHVFASKTFAGVFSGVKNSLQSIINIMNLGGYLDRNMYLYTIPAWLVQFFNIVFISCWLGILHSLFFLKSKEVKKYENPFLFWLLVFTVSVFVVKGGNVPLSEATMELFTKFPLMRLFRSPQHLMIFPAILIPLLLTFAMTRYTTMRYKYAPTVLAGLVAVWISGWFLTGDIGKSTLAVQKKDRIDLFELSPELSAFYEQDRANPLNRRVIFLPAVASPIYKKTTYHNPAQGVIPEYMYLKNSTLTAEDNIFARQFELLFCTGKQFNFVNYLALFGVKTIVVRDDIVPTFTDCRTRFDAKDVIKVLDHESRITKTHTSKYLTIYEIQNASTLLPVYVPRSVSTSSAAPTKLAPIVSADTYRFSEAIYFAGQNKNTGIIKKLSTKPLEKPTVQYKKINPTKYRIKIFGARSAFPLVLSNVYHSLWKLYVPPSGQKNSQQKYVSALVSGTVQNNTLPAGHWYDIFTNKVAVSEKDHLVANGYANSWIVDPKTICKIDGACTQNPNGTYNIDLLIEFELQKYWYAGTAITGLVLVIIAGLYAKKTKHKNS